jgi:hypothetical protein
MVYIEDLKSSVCNGHAGSSPAPGTKIVCDGSIPVSRTNYRRSCMLGKDTINKAYGNVPKEVGFNFDMTWVPTIRGFKYYWLKLVRKVTR